MKQFRIQELDVEVGDIVVCVSESSEMYTAGVKYEVKQAEDGKLGVVTDCGYIATTSASLFTPLNQVDERGVTSEMSDLPVLKRSSLPTPTQLRTTETNINDNFQTYQANVRRRRQGMSIAA